MTLQKYMVSVDVLFKQQTNQQNPFNLSEKLPRAAMTFLVRVWIG